MIKPVFLNYKRMAKRICKSLIFSLLALAAIFIVNFFLPRLIPGDPLQHLTGADDKAITQEQYDQLYHDMGLDKPLGEQFASYIKGTFNGELGFSYHHGKDAADIIREKIPRTLQVALPAWLISAFLAYVLGLRAGFKKRSLLSGGMVILDAVPSFLIAILLLIVFSFKLELLPFGALNSTIPPSTAGGRLLDRILHLILPVLTLVLATTPKKFLLMRNTAASAADLPYVAYAKSKGLRPGRIRRMHIFPNVSAPFISMLGTSFGHMIAGSIIVEKIFSIDGIGMLVNRAIADLDYPVLQASLLIIAVSVIVSNFIADVICALCDPRQRRGV